MNTGKYRTFSVPVEKKKKKKKELIKIDKKLEKNISYRLQCTNEVRFMASSWPNIVNNLADGIHKIKWKTEHDNKKCKTFRIK